MKPDSAQKAAKCSKYGLNVQLRDLPVADVLGRVHNGIAETKALH
jgi:hypothetical protein